MKINRSLALGALLLAALAMVVRNPREEHKVTLDLKSLAGLIESEKDHLTPGELAAALMDQGSHVRVVDIRDSTSFAAYHIPRAERVNLTALVESSFPQNDSVVVYSDGGIHAAQAWMLLVAKGEHNVYTLRGGLNAWEDSVLYPVISTAMSKGEGNRIMARARFFGGEARMKKKGDVQTKPNVKPETKPQNPDTKTPKEEEKIREVC
ncbi:MAG: rhodanese-like domain-containing protein [Bacteroidota bacterium]